MTNRALIVVAGLSTSLALAGGLAAAGTAGVSTGTKSSATVVIKHQMRGCHSWAVDGGAYRVAQTVRLARGGTIRFVDNDVMPHKLIQKSGPAVHYLGTPDMGRIGAFVKATFPKAGTYTFATKVGEDYMKGVKTMGEDNVLRLTVTVS